MPEDQNSLASLVKIIYTEFDSTPSKGLGTNIKSWMDRENGEIIMTLSPFSSL
jgi:hypothetical protein